MSTATMICIACPIGCLLTISQNGQTSITGNACPRGIAYAQKELTAPERMVTTTVRLMGATLDRLPVRMAQPVPKASIQRILDCIHGERFSAPIQIGDVLMKDVAGTGIDLVATRSIPSV